MPSDSESVAKLSYYTAGLKEELPVPDENDGVEVICRCKVLRGTISVKFDCEVASRDSYQHRQLSWTRPLL